GFCFGEVRFKTYTNSKDIDLWQVIQNDDFNYEVEDSETKLMKEMPYELLEDVQKKKLGKNNKAKMTLYNALPRKEYERVFLCKTAKEFSISSKETIDSGFTRFNAIVTSLKSLDPDYSSKNYMRKFLHALPLKWRAKVMTIEEFKDMATHPLDELIRNLKVYEMVLDNDGVGSKTTKEKVKSLALKNKVTREQTSDDRDSQGGSDKDIDEKEAKAFNLIEGHFASECRKPKENKDFIGGAWSNIEDGDEHQKDATCLMAIDSQEIVSKSSSSNINLNIIDLQKDNEELLRFNKDFAKTFEILLNEKHSLESKNSKLSSKINDLEIEVKKLANDKEVVKPCKHVIKAYIVLNKETMRIEESLNVTFDESLPEPKSSPSVEDDRINEPIVQDLNVLGLKAS
ncbi:hypothetical protein Tco_1333851, partial [Tanacetum coccineum]